jgi:hypothetical protein
MRKLLLSTVILLCLTFALGQVQEWWGISAPAEVKAAPSLVSYKSGHATWYSLCNGSNGACEDCDDDEMHAAWPHLDATNCHRYCSYVGSLSCGSSVLVSDQCPYKYWVEVEIHDCCTCDGEGGCDGWSRCSGDWWNADDVIIDLTRTAFISLHGSLDDGRIPAGVYY